MAVQYSIQKMVSNGTLSTIALGIPYLQRNDIYIRIAGEETPQVGAPSGYTWSFINNTTLKIIPVVPNGVEVVVYRRTDVDAMYNIYSQNAQFDEATIDENNQQLLYIAQEYLEQGIPGAGVATIEFLRDDGSNTYYRIKRTDGSYSEEFAVPSAGSITKILAHEALRRSYAEAGYNLVAGSFEAGGALVNANDVLLQERTGKAFSGPAGTVSAGTNPTSGGFTDRSGDLGFGEILLDRYGADPSGVLDSSAALALANAAATAIGGGNVAIVLSPGATYRIASHTPINNPLVCYGNRATVKFDYLWSSPMSYVFPSPRQLSNVVLQAVNAGLHTVNLMAGEGYFLEIEKTTMVGFADALANSGVYVNLRKCRFENNLRAWTPKRLSSQNAPSTMFSASETIFVRNVEDGIAVRPGTSGANDDLISLELRSCGFEQNGNGLIALQRIWHLTMVNCWFEGNVNKAYDIRASNPTIINTRVHPSDAAKTNISGWAAGSGSLSGTVNEIGEGGTQTRNMWLHDVSQDSYPSTKKTRIRKVGDNTRISEDGGTTEKSLVLSSNLSTGTRASIEIYVPASATSIADVVGAPSGWTMTKSGTGIYQFTMPTTLTVRPAITVTVVQNMNLADEDKTAKVALGNTDAATWNSFKTVNQFRVYTKSVSSLADIGFTLKMLV